MFSAGMGLLLLAYDALTMLLGWEAIGTCSYLLIGHFWYRSEAAKASLKAIAANRLGDIGLLLATVLGLWLYGDSTLGIWNSCTSYTATGRLRDTSTALTISVGAVLSLYCKSAQYGMHGWLMDAMEGPTPVSALLHSATLVTAGLAIMVKLEGVWSMAPGISLGLLLIGATSTLLASAIAMTQLDIKRMVALSTAVHIGLMTMALGTGNIAWSCEHLFIHGWVKSTLFMAVGTGIHTLHSQDVRKANGGLLFNLPLIACIMLLACLAVSGMPGSHIGSIKDMLLVMGVNQTDCRVIMIGVLTGVWLSQGYAASVCLTTWHECGVSSSPQASQPLGLRVSLATFSMTGTLLPYVMGDQTPLSGQPELGDTSTWCCIDPLGSAVLVGVAAGILRGPFKLHATRYGWHLTLPNQCLMHPYRDASVPCWQRSGLDKLASSLASSISVLLWQRSTQDIDQGSLGALFMLQPSQQTRGRATDMELLILVLAVGQV
jgi:NADH:ubiquinone oxidoreductase subunit 5 (subunit L)/multisubunit Na+/H+ antiporter MnhA subunit